LGISPLASTSRSMAILPSRVQVRRSAGVYLPSSILDENSKLITGNCQSLDPFFLAWSRTMANPSGNVRARRSVGMCVGQFALHQLSKLGSLLLSPVPDRISSVANRPGRVRAWRSAGKIVGSWRPKALGPRRNIKDINIVLICRMNAARACNRWAM